MEIVQRQLDLSGSGSSWLEQECSKVRRGERSATQPKQHFATYAVSLLKQKVAAGDIKSKAGIEKWETTLQHFAMTFAGFATGLRPS